MAHIHVAETAIEDERLGTITAIVETDKFKYEAVGGKVGAVNVYIEWYDDDGDLLSFEDWADARSHFTFLLNRNKAKV